MSDERIIHYVSDQSDSPVSACGHFVSLCTSNWDKVTCVVCMGHKLKSSKPAHVAPSVVELARKLDQPAMKKRLARLLCENFTEDELYYMDIVWRLNEYGQVFETARKEW